SCGLCNTGTQSRTCSNSCSWGPFGPCNDPAQCSPGQQESKSCGLCNTGTQSRTCTNSCTWGAFGACNDPAQCSPGQQDSKSCGLCNTGTQSRTCGNSCSWGPFGPCNDPAQCSPGQQEPCGVCGIRACANNCQWGLCVDLTKTASATVYTTDDTFIHSWPMNSSNFNGMPIQVGSLMFRNGTVVMRAALRFPNVPDLLPKSATVSAVQLCATYIPNTLKGGNSIVLAAQEVNCSDPSWNESTITWDLWKNQNQCSAFKTLATVTFSGNQSAVCFKIDGVDFKRISTHGMLIAENVDAYKTLQFYDEVGSQKDSPRLVVDYKYCP
ncbi:MAG: hypothetical protein HY744_22880, partial [Deltaproteobacteria bacterium]|nr:hypothetical protein [Deltaproteobacteria bacterium]